MMRLLTFFLCCWISSSVWAADRVVCVTRDRAEAPQGAVIASTLQKGIALAGKYKQKGDDVTLLVAGGTYRLDKTLEMTARELGLTAGSLVVRPLDGAKVIFYGGVEIPAQYIEQAPASESRIRPEFFAPGSPGVDRSVCERSGPETFPMAQRYDGPDGGSR